jgi:hypothetical protein
MQVMIARRTTWTVWLVALAAGGLLACGGDDICLQCPTGTPTPGESGVTVTGQIASVNPFTNPASINVVICVGLAEGQSVEDCPNTFLTTATTEGLFTRRNVQAGAESIFFWVDVDGNGMIDPADPLAQLVDTEGQLDDVQNGQTVTLSNVRIAFLENSATADITIGLTPTPTPSAAQPTATPIPSPS